MKKKLITFALAAIILMAFSVTVFADNITNTAIVYGGDGSIHSVECKTEGVTVGTGMYYLTQYELLENNPEEYKRQKMERENITEEQAEYYMEWDRAFYHNASQHNEAIRKFAAENNFAVEDSVNIELNSADGTWDGSPIYITFPGVKVGDDILVVHCSHKTGDWVLENARVVADDTIVLEGITEFSPFVISKGTVQAPVAAAAPAPAVSAPVATENTDAVPTSPKTGFSLKTLFAAIADLF